MVRVRSGGMPGQTRPDMHWGHDRDGAHYWHNDLEPEQCRVPHVTAFPIALAATPLWYMTCQEIWFANKVDKGIACCCYGQYPKSAVDDEELANSDYVQRFKILASQAWHTNLYVSKDHNLQWKRCLARVSWGIYSATSKRSSPSLQYPIRLTNLSCLTCPTFHASSCHNNITLHLMRDITTCQIRIRLWCRIETKWPSSRFLLMPWDKAVSNLWPQRFDL